MKNRFAVLCSILAVALVVACGGAEGEEEDDEATSAIAESGGARTVALTEATATPPATVSPAATASPSPTPSPTATPSPTPSPTPEAAVPLPTTCQFPADTTSFRLTMTFGESPEIGWGAIFGTVGGGGGRGISGGLLDLFGGLSEDATVEFTYVAPDRWSMVISEGGEECCSYIIIGSQVWYKDGESAAWTKQPNDFEEFASFTPQEFCEVVESLPMSMGSQGAETINGIETVHYQIANENSIYDWLVGEESPEYSYDIWLAEAGNWPVKFIFDAECEMTWEISDLNDPSIVIEAPTLS